MSNYPEIEGVNYENGVPQPQDLVYYPSSPQICVITPTQEPKRVSTTFLFSHIILLIIVTSVEYLCVILYFYSLEAFIWMIICLCFLTLCLVLDILTLILQTDLVLLAVCF